MDFLSAKSLIRTLEFAGVNMTDFQRRTISEFLKKLDDGSPLIFPARNICASLSAVTLYNPKVFEGFQRAAIEKQEEEMRGKLFSQVTLDDRTTTAQLLESLSHASHCVQPNKPPKIKRWP